MKYLKTFDLVNESYDQVADICQRYRINTWTTNKDGTIDVYSDVALNDYKLSKLPLRFGKVIGNFNCNGNNLTMLDGAPEYVSGNFDCSSNYLSSLEGCPQLVGSHFLCSNNYLKSLRGCPQSVGGHFLCRKNQIRDFEGIGSTTIGYFYCDENPISEIWNLFKDSSKIELLNDYDIIRDDLIVLDRLNDFLRVIGKDTVTEVAGYKCV